MDDLERVGQLQDPVRRRLYEFVVAQRGEVGRGEAAEAAGVSRTLAAHHLDRLVEAGLLDSAFRPQEKKGPGSGRPAKVYRRAAQERSVSLPPRDYATLARVLAETVDLLGGEEQAEKAARAAGERIGRKVGGPLERILRERGYQPYQEGGRLRMRNCPFHVLAEDEPILVCGVNLALCQGMLEGIGDDPDGAELDPRPGECCVSFAQNSKTNED
ncbi:helix-turn-helix transcriptional regulator [Nonomuraea sediminis]|uniref:helix-turn-helix transcriptional regulator n=1 Tax=Nonomuraea sediminis TaxID=2835864 RepID=UPI001BDC96A6|nr:helix-turn-helix domain-containing protein [Nonomuraea sediminis]